MVMHLTKLELHDIERLSRQQLVDAVMTSRHHLPDDLVDRAADFPTDRLRLLVLVGRLVCVLRLLQNQLPERDGGYDTLFPL